MPTPPTLHTTSKITQGTMGYKRPHNDTYKHQREALRTLAQKNHWPCALCGQPINYQLPYTHPMSFTADHITPLAQGGQATGQLQPAHRSCNARKGAHHDPHTQLPAPHTTRQW